MRLGNTLLLLAAAVSAAAATGAAQENTPAPSPPAETPTTLSTANTITATAATPSAAAAPVPTLPAAAVEAHPASVDAPPAPGADAAQAPVLGGLGSGRRRLRYVTRKRASDRQSALARDRVTGRVRKGAATRYGSEAYQRRTRYPAAVLTAIELDARLRSSAQASGRQRTVVCHGSCDLSRLPSDTPVVVDGSAILPSGAPAAGAPSSTESSSLTSDAARLLAATKPEEDVTYRKGYYDGRTHEAKDLRGERLRAVRGRRGKAKRVLLEA
ncbi:hypothetical protein DFJ73DRAFT_920997 [Zopfochytrium polystomum]|nr:hypothetical protein DFJ73DRAFT_920997 [Zopfochytrium polystomum]